jgi:NAD(P)H-hydrate epimerase
LKKLQQKAKKHQINILLKGKYSAIASPEGQIYFNSTGNNSMAKGGSGDVLSGIIGGIFPLTKNPLQSAINAAFLHGLSGDIATDKYGEDYVTPSILIENLHLAQKMCTQTQ